MDETQKPNQSPEEPEDSLAAAPLRPVDELPVSRLGGLTRATLTLTVSGAGTLWLIAATMTPTVGATRSAKLQWCERQLQIEQALHDSQVQPGASEIETPALSTDLRESIKESTQAEEQVEAELNANELEQD